MLQMPTAFELLGVWERERHSPPLHRSLALLAATCPEAYPEQLAALSIGARDGLLLTLREQLFGPRLRCVASCPRCADQLEFAFDATDIRADLAPDTPLALEADGYALRFRLPSSLDLAAVAGEPSARARLIERCLLGAERGGAAVTVADLPAEITAEVAAAMGRADPQADVQLAMSCPACGEHWPARFDIASYLWEELEGWARRTLIEVHILAAAYHWREQEILALSPWRRTYYLELVQA